MSAARWSDESGEVAKKNKVKTILKIKKTEERLGWTVMSVNEETFQRLHLLVNSFCCLPLIISIRARSKVVWVQIDEMENCSKLTNRRLDTVCIHQIGSTALVKIIA